MQIIKFEPKYRDDLIFMILEAKNALGRVPGLNEDLLDIQKNYIDKGDVFWIALDDNDRVIGSVGYNSIANSDDVVLHRLFVKANLKRQGIGTALLKTAEEYLISIGKKAAIVHLGTKSIFMNHGSFIPNTVMWNMNQAICERNFKKQRFGTFTTLTAIRQAKLLSVVNQWHKMSTI